MPDPTPPAQPPVSPAKPAMSKIDMVKVLTSIISGLGLIGMASQQLQSVSLPGHWNVIVAGAGLLSTDILHIIQQLQTPAVKP